MVARAGDGNRPAPPLAWREVEAQENARAARKIATEIATELRNTGRH